jgi:hypothetical protein
MIVSNAGLQEEVRTIAVNPFFLHYGQSKLELRPLVDRLQ